MHLENLGKIVFVNLSVYEFFNTFFAWGEIYFENNNTMDGLDTLVLDCIDSWSLQPYYFGCHGNLYLNNCIIFNFRFC